MRRLVTLVTVVLLLCGTGFAQTGRGVVTGQVRLLDGAPASDVRVSVMDLAAEANPLAGTSLVSWTQSDSDGRYRLEGIPPGRYILAAGPTFALSYYPGARELADATAVTVAAGAVVTGMDFVLARPPGLRIAGRVVRDPRQTGPPPKTIALNTSLGEMARRDISTDGSFDFGRVAPGAYILQVAAAMPNLPSLSKAIRVDEKDITDIAFVVPLSVPVSGRVTVSGGALPPGVRFGLSQPGGAVGPIELAAQPDGTFNAMLPEGEYRVFPRGLPVQYQVDSITDGHTDLLNKPLHVGFEESNQITVHVTTSALWVKVRGRVEGLENLPQPAPPGRQPRVRLVGGAPVNFDAEVAPDGAFEFASVPPGQYVLFTDPQSPSGGSFVSVPNHAIDGVVMRVPALRSITGRVTVSNGEPPKQFGMLLTAIPEESGKLPMTVHADVGAAGAFVARVPEGEYRAEIRELPSGYYEIKPMSQGSVDLTRESLRIGSQASQELAVTLGLSNPDSWATLRGRMAPEVTTSSASLGGNRVALRGQSVTFSADTTFGPDGSFEFAGVPPGSYEILIPGAPTVVLDVRDKSNGPIDITIPTLRRVSVRIDVEGGAVAPLLQIAAASLPTLAGADFKLFQQLQVQPAGTTTLTLPDGQYRVRLTGLPEDSYQLRSIRYKAANLLDGTLNISGGAVEPIVIVLTAKPDALWARLSGRVTGGATNVTKVVISGPTNLEAPVGADRSFQTPKLPAGAYTIRANSGTSSATALVAGKDVEGIELIVPAQRQITGRVDVEDRGPAPARVAIWLTPTNASSFSQPFTTMASVRPDGTFTVSLPVGEYYFGLNTASGGIPPEYQLTAAAYATKDLLKEPVVINAAASELRLSFSVTRPVPWVKVSGRLSGQTRFPANTRVVLADRQNGSTVESAIAPDGSFEFAKVLPGVYTAGLNPAPSGAVPVAVIVEGKDVGGVNLLVPGLKSIAGQLVFEGGAPPLPRLSIALTNAAIRAASTGVVTLSANVQPNGSFTANFPEGEYQASITGLPVGYQVKAWTYGSKDLLRQPWKIAMNDVDSMRVTLDLAPAVSFVKVSGHVTGGSSSAVQRVALLPTSAVSGSQMEATVAADGAFEFDRVLSGSYMLRPNPSPTGARSLTIVVTDKDITDINLVAPAQKRIAVQAVVEGGGPLPRFSIALIDVGASGNRFTVSATTNAPDALSVTVPEGEYRASIASLPEIYRVKAFRYGATDLLNGPWKVAVADTHNLHVTLELAPTVSLVKVSGHLTGSTSSNQRVTLSSSPAGLSMEATVAPDGSFEFLKVPTGSYSARPVPAPAGVTAAAVAVTVTVADKDVSGINLVIPGQKRVTVRTVVEGGVPIPRFAVVLNGAVAASRRTIQVTSGNAIITVSEGEYPVSITGLPDSLQVKALTYGAADLLKQPWKVASADSDELRVTLAPAPSVSLVKVTGRVTGLDNRSNAFLATRRVRLSGASGSIESLLAGDGSFGFANVTPGTYSLSVTQTVTPVGQRVPAITVHVADRDIDVELAVRRVSGAVKVEGGNPLPGFSIEFRSADAENTTTVQADGTFVALLLDGEYRITASQLPAGYRVKSMRFADDPAGPDFLSQPLKVTSAALPSIVIGVDAASVRAFKVSGHVSGMTNVPQSSTRRVILAPRPSGRSLEAPIASDGSFEFAQVLPGRYAVRMNPTVPGVAEKEITVSDTNIAGVDFAIPGQKRLTIRAVVDEGGALPAFSLSIRPRTSTSSAGTSSVSFRPASTAPQLTAAEGDLRVDITGVTAGYRVKSAMYGTVDTLKDGLRVTAADTAQEIVVTFSMTGVAFKVSGRVLGASSLPQVGGSSNTGRRVVLGRVGANGTAVSNDAQQAPIGAGGAFEFPKVPAGTYVLSVSPTLPGLASKTVTVDKDLTDVEIAIPGQRQIRGRVVMESGGLLPQRLDLTLDRVADGSRALSGSVVIATDGSFTAGLPEGEYRAVIADLPNTLRLKSWTYGSSDLLQQPLRLTAAASGEMLITLDFGAGVKTARVSGRVVNAEGLGDRDRRVTLSPVTATVTGFGGFSQTALPRLSPSAPGAPSALAAINADGSFEFPRVLPGAYVLAAVPAPPGVTVSRSVTVADRDLANIELNVPVSRDVVMRMAVPQGIPAPRVSMRWRGVDGASLTRAVSIGGIADSVAVPLPVGEYRLEVGTLPDSYELKSVVSGSVDLLNQTLRIAADSAPEVRVTLGVREKAAWFKVRGRVAGEDAAFSAVTLSGGAMALTARANSDGAFEFSTVPPGSYIIRLASAIQPLSPIDALALSSGAVVLSAVEAALPAAFRAPLPPVSVTVADRDVDGVELKVPVDRLLRGRVRVEGDAPWPRVSLIVAAARAGQPITFKSRPDGTFSVLVPPGQYTVTPSALPEGYLLKSIMYGAQELGLAPLNVEENKPLDELTITVEASAPIHWVRVKGRVTGLQGPVVEGASLLFAQPAGWEFEAPLNADGSFEFQRVRPGAYGALLLPNPGGVSAKPITIGEADARNVEFAAPAVRQIRGRVVVEGAGPMPRVSLTLVSNAPQSAGALIRAPEILIDPQPDGRFSIAVPEGVYRAAVSVAAGGYRVRSLTLGSVDLLKENLQAPTRGAAEMRITLVAPAVLDWMKVSGKVSGLPPSGGGRPRVVKLDGPIPGLEGRIQPDGSFEIPRALRGSYIAYVDAGVPGASARRITVGRSDLTDVDITLRRPATVSGRVKLDTGRPLPNLSRLTVSIADPDGASLNARLDSAARATPNANGTFQILLYEGVHRIVVNGIPAGYRVKSIVSGGTELTRGLLNLIAPSGAARVEIEIVLTRN